MHLMHKVQRLMHKVRTNYNSCIVPSTENICSNSGGAQGNGKTGWNSVLWASITPLMLMGFFFLSSFRVFWISSPVWPNSGFGCWVYLTLWITMIFIFIFKYIFVIFFLKKKYQLVGENHQMIKIYEIWHHENRLNIFYKNIDILTWWCISFFFLI